MRLSCLMFSVLFAGMAHALGNYPEAGNCPADRPWFAVCTHSLHSLEGWQGKQCYADRAAAQHEAEQHAAKYHNGNMRWTGVQKQR